MSTLAQQRAAIAAGMQAARSSNAAAERQAIHDNMVARRTGRGVQRDLNSLESSKRKSGELKGVEPRGARPATRSAGEPRVEPARTTGGGGIASPLTEAVVDVGGDLVADREYYAAGITSSDGLLVLPAIKKQTFTDANDAEVVFDFATPGALP